MAEPALVLALALLLALASALLTLQLALALVLRAASKPNALFEHTFARNLKHEMGATRISRSTNAGQKHTC